MHAAFTSGMDRALVVAGAVAVAGAVLSLLFLPARGPAPDDEIAPLPPVAPPAAAESVA